MRDWIYLHNPFLTAVDKDFKKAVKISEWHDTRLQAASAGSVFIAGLYTIYHPLHLALVDGYNQWKASGGVHKGATLGVAQLLKLLSPGKINMWDSQVQNVFAKGSVQYVALFPQKHKPFANGSYLARNGAVHQLSTAMSAIVALAATKADVDAFGTLLNDAINDQGGYLGNTETASVALTALVKTTMEGMYNDLGQCISNSPADPTVYESLFDLDTIRNHEQLIWTGGLNANENHVVLIHKFHDADEMKVSAFETPVQYYLAAKANSAPGTNTIINVDANTDSTIAASAFGNLSHRFLHVINNSALPGHFRVELL